VLIPKDVRWGGARPSSDLADGGHLDAVRKVFQTAANSKLHGAVDIVKIFKPGVLWACSAAKKQVIRVRIPIV
jgi:hypothetical protein